MSPNDPEQGVLFQSPPPSPRAVHCRKAPAGSFVYVGRPHPLGNPFPLDNPRDAQARAQVIAAYRAYLLDRVEHDPEFRSALEQVRGRDLGCWCAPKPCHADVILEWLAAHPPE